MSRKRPAVDGFIPRRRKPPESGSMNGLIVHTGEHGLQPREYPESHGDIRAEASSPHAGSIGRADIDASLRDIDDDTAVEQKKHHKQRISRRKLIKRIILALLVIALLAGGYVMVKAILAGGNIFKGDLLGLIQAAPLKQDANGRSNILILGTSGTVESPDHDGADLTDSIIVLSVDQNKKDAYMVSLPRDLWVKYDTACSSGFQGKINVVYECGGKDEAGAKALMDKASEVTGFEIQYYAHVNWAVLTSAVDAVGGVEVTIESNPKGQKVLDRNFDWTCNYRCYFVNYDDGERVHLDGEHALALARARGASAPNSGLLGGNFDRERNQQKIIVALRDKAVSAGTLMNIGKVTGLIDSLGANVSTSFETKEIQTLMNLSKDIPSEKITSIDLSKDSEAVVVNARYDDGQSIVRPIKGLLDYSGIVAYIKRQINSDEATKEAASLGVYNGSGVGGIAKKVGDELSDKGFVVDIVDNAPEGTYSAYEIYDISGGKKPATKAKLEKLYNTTAKTGTPPISYDGLDFVIIVGKAPETTDSTTAN